MERTPKTTDHRPVLEATWSVVPHERTPQWLPQGVAPVADDHTGTADPRVDRRSGHADTPANEPGYRIVVGVDGSEDAAAALRWAVEHVAGRADAHLVVVHAWSASDPVGMMIGVEGFEGQHEAARRVLSDAEAQAGSTDGPIVTGHLEYGPPAAAILEAAEGAELVVVGHRGLGRLGGLILGSVSRAVVTKSAAPVVLIRATSSWDRGPVVVGIDDSTGARTALRWAADHARRHELPLRVVHAFQPRHFAGLIGMTELQPDLAWRREATQALSALVHDELGDQSDRADVEVVATHAEPAAGLLSGAEDASLIVVGSRGRGGASSVLLGSVSSDVLARSDRPVVVVPDAHSSAARDLAAIAGVEVGGHR